MISSLCRTSARFSIVGVATLAGCNQGSGGTHDMQGEQAMRLKGERCCCNLLVDGDFEYRASPSLTEETPFDGQAIDNLRWIVHTGNTAATGGQGNNIALFADRYSTTNHLFFATPDGEDFVYIGMGPTNGNLPPYPSCTLSQDVASPLAPVRKYAVSLLQSAFGDTSAQHGNVAGHVHVDVIPTGGGTPIYQEDFNVPSGTTLGASAAQWRPQVGKTFSPPTLGLYTIRLTSDDPNRVAVVDDVRLCAK